MENEMKTIDTFSTQELISELLNRGFTVSCKTDEIPVSMYGYDFDEMASQLKKFCKVAANARYKAEENVEDPDIVLTLTNNTDKRASVYIDKLSASKGAKVKFGVTIGEPK
jgi:hypothetical protein